MDRRRWGRRLSAGAALAVTTIAAVGCGEPEFQYPHDEVEGVYFKVPSAWTVFDQTDDYFDGRIEATGTAQPVRVWTLDASDDADADHASVRDGDVPVGRAQIVELTSSASELVSISAVRSLGFDFDPVSPATGLDEVWEVALDQPLRTADGISGAVAIFNFRAEADDEWLTQAREVFLDPTRQRLYLLDIYCSAACFDEHRDDIFDVLDSWRIDL